MTSEPGVAGLSRDKSGGRSRFWPGGVRRKVGVSVVLAFISNSGTSRVVDLVETQGTGLRRGQKAEGKST